MREAEATYWVQRQRTTRRVEWMTGGEGAGSDGKRC
jgi:hypothetical protein